MKITRRQLTKLIKEAVIKESEQNANLPASAIVDLPDVLTDGGVLLSSMNDFNLDFRLLSRFGPGGGSPACRLSGAYGDLFNWMTTYYLPGEPAEAREHIDIED